MVDPTLFGASVKEQLTRVAVPAALTFDGGQSRVGPPVPAPAPAFAFHGVSSVLIDWTGGSRLLAPLRAFFLTPGGKLYMH